MLTVFSDVDSIKTRLREIHIRLKRDLPGISRVAVAMYDDRTDLLKTFVHSTDGETPFSHYEAKLAMVPSLQLMVATRKPRAIGEFTIADEGGSPHIRRLAETGYKSSYTTPFYDHGLFIGFIFFDSPEAFYFSESTIRHLSVYAHLISLLIINELSRARALRSAIDIARTMSHTHNEETGSHLNRMARFARIIARHLAEKSQDERIDDEFIEFVFLYAPLHDVGKIAIPDSILLKPGKLSSEEFAIMQTHVAAGMSIVESITRGFHVGLGQHADVLRNIVRYHHEAFDGSGYLAGLKGQEIPLEARIVTVADVFDALTTTRCYKEAWSNDSAFALLQEHAGQRFDPVCVQALIDCRNEAETVQQQFAANNMFHEAYMPGL